MIVSKLTLPMAVMVTICTGAIGAGTIYGAMTSHIIAITERIDATTRRIEDLERESSAIHDRLSRMETALEYQNESLRRIETRLGTLH